jgi:hypothetical protein
MRLVRHWCASETGDNRIQPEGKPHEQATSANPSHGRIMWLIVYTAVYIL